MLQDDSKLGEIESELDEASQIDERQSTMLRYAIKLTQTPDKMVEQDVIDLRQVGFSDRDILHIAEVTAYYAYVNRIADGLGVKLERE